MMSQSCYQMRPNVTKSSNQHSCEGLRYLVWGHNQNRETCRKPFISVRFKVYTGKRSIFIAKV